MSVDRRTFLGLGSLATASALVGCATGSGRPVRHDPSLTVFVSDVHAKRGEHTLGRFERVVGLILSAWPEYRRRTLVRDRSVFKRWLCFPSTGSWGDIGFVAMRTEPGRARAELVLLEHFYPNPNQRSWLDEEIVAEKGCCACTFRW